MQKFSPLGAYLSQEQIRKLASCCGVMKFTPDKVELAESPFYLVLFFGNMSGFVFKLLLLVLAIALRVR